MKRARTEMSPVDGEQAVAELEMPPHVADDDVAPGQPGAQSRRALRKLEHKKHKKIRKQEDRITRHKEMLEDARRLRESLEPAMSSSSSTGSYRSILTVSDVEVLKGAENVLTDSEKSAVHWVQRFLQRPPKYQDKYASQELSLLFHLFMLGGTPDVIVDVGAGNANLSLLASLVFDVPVICVEMESPRVELRAEELVPEALRGRLERVEK